jgi:hypothetical protein
MILAALLSTLGLGGIGALAFFFVPGAAKTMLQVWDWITASKVNLLLVVCLVLAGSTYWCWHGWEKTEKVLASTETAYRNAQADAELAQAALNARKVATNEAINKGSTDANAKGLVAASAAVAAYARLHTCPARETSRAASTPVPADPKVDVGTGEAPGMVATSVTHLDWLAAGTVRAESCRALGQAWIDAGLGEVGD